MSLRILHISTRLILGGSQENTVLSCEGQSRSGHEVHLAYGPIYGPEGSMLDRVMKFNSGASNPIVTHEVANLIREVRVVRDWRCLRQLEALIWRIRPDVVHTHSSKAGILGRFAAARCLRRGLKVGIVHTIHGPPFMPVEGSMVARAKTRFVNWCYACAERAAARRSHVIVSVADAMTEQFRLRGIGYGDQYVTVRSGIELEPYVRVDADETREAVRARLGLGVGDFVIGTVARLAEHKGHDDILTALGPLVRERADWRLLWVGDGWWRDRLVLRAREMGVETKLVMTGLVSGSAIPGLMRAMDVLCHASSREGLPRTVPQALLAGTCAVAYDVDGTREVCKEMETGRLVGHGDIDGLRAAVVSLAANASIRAQLAARGRSMCLEEFSADGMVARLEEVYARAMSMAR